MNRMIGGNDQSRRQPAGGGDPIVGTRNDDPKGLTTRKERPDDASRNASRVAAPSARAGCAAGSRYSGAPGSAACGRAGSQRRSSAA